MICARDFLRHASPVSGMLALVAFFWSASPAAAVVYDFSFTASGTGAPSGTIQMIVSDLNGVVTGATNGTGTLAGAALSIFHYNTSVYGDMPSLRSTSSQPYFYGAPTNAFVLRVASKFYAFQSTSLYVYTATGATDGGGYPMATYDAGFYSLSGGRETLTAAPAPAPLPGAGWLSWLLVGGFAAWRRREAAAFASVWTLITRMTGRVGRPFPAVIELVWRARPRRRPARGYSA